jgi:hypothetical protein
VLGVDEEWMCWGWMRVNEEADKRDAHECRTDDAVIERV